jgi:hypothetical protein
MKEGFLKMVETNISHGKMQDESFKANWQIKNMKWWKSLILHLTKKYKYRKNYILNTKNIKGANFG